MPGVGTPQNGHGPSNAAVTGLIVGCVAPIVTIAAARLGIADWIWLIQPVLVAAIAAVVHKLNTGRVRKD